MALICPKYATGSDNQPRTIKLPPQSLEKTLIDIGNQFGISIIFPSELTFGKNVEAIAGDYTAAQLLKQIIPPAQLEFKQISPRAVAIVPAKSSASSTQKAILPTYFEEVTVHGRALTGSRINRPQYQGSAPVDIITAPELANSGAQTLVEFLKFTPAVAGNSTSTTVSNGGDGTASVTLRGLPANNTLVLINGRRVAFDGKAGSSVDLNTIAPIAVERIEILTDGASAIYGSDAIAGVVNVILKKEFEGASIEQYVGTSSRGDLDTTNTNLIAGKKFENGHLTIAGSVYDQEGLFSRQRGFSETADARSQGGADQRSSATPAARVVLPDGNGLTLAQDNSGAYLSGQSIADYRTTTDDDRYNYNQQTSSTSPSTREALYLALNSDLSENLSFFADANYAETSATITLAPTPYFSILEGDAPVSASNQYNPFGVDIFDVRKRLVELGNREQLNETKSQRFNASLEGYWRQTRWQSYAFWSETRSHQVTSGLASRDRTMRAVGPAEDCRGANIDGCVPLNLFSAPGAIDAQQLAYIAESEIVDGASVVSGGGLDIDGIGFALPAGDSYWAAGAEYRREQADVDARALNGSTGFVSSSIGQSIEGAREVSEVFIEWHLPIFKSKSSGTSLDLELAARHSYYSDFGSDTSPKIGLKYYPFSSLLVRGSFGSGFRAPSLEQINAEGFETASSLDDPCSLPANVGVLPGCSRLADSDLVQFSTTFFVDGNLAPEQSDNTTVGFVWRPEFLSGARLSMDWFQIEQADVISASPQAILNENALTGELSELVQRNDDGNIIRIFVPSQNLGTRDISGLDITANFLHQTERFGHFLFTANAVNLREYRERSDQFSSEVNLAGDFIDSSAEGSGPLPKWKASAGLEWTKARWQVNYSVNHIDSMRETVRFTNTPRTINSWTTHNIQVNLQAAKSFKLTLGVDNLFDAEPPFVVSTITDNFDAFAYNPRQQYWYVRVGVSL